MPILHTIEELRSFAARNSGKRFGIAKAWEREEFAKRLAKGRQMDRDGTWGVSSDASLEHISNEVYHLDLLGEICNHQAKRKKGYTFLDLGGGAGKLSAEVARKIDKKVTVLVTGITRNNRWKHQINAQRIRPIVTHTEQLSKRVPLNSVDFINASYSILHSQHIMAALEECRLVLKKGGRIIFNMGSRSTGFENPTQFQNPPKGFKFVMPPKEVLVKRGTLGFEDTIIYLKKI